MIISRREVDMQACIDAVHECHLVDTYPVNWPDDPAAWLHPDQLLGAWTAHTNAQVAGHIALVNSAPGWAAVSRLFVRPSCQGHGLAVGLLDTALHHAHTRDLRVELDVVEESAAAIRLYERLGWTLIAREPAPFTWTDGTRPTQRRYQAPTHNPH